MHAMQLNKDYLPSIALGVTQIIGYGTLMYAYSVLLPHMAKDLDMSLSSVFGVLSLALFFGGMAAPLAGMAVDRFGGRYVMTLGAIVAGAALMGLSWVTDRYWLFAMILVAEAAGMFVLYQTAFASVVRLDNSVKPARAISVITLFGGVASTIFWPLTLWLYNAVGWQQTWLWLGVLVIFVSGPLYFWALSGPQKDPTAPQNQAEQDWPHVEDSDRKRAMLWMIVSFVFSGYLMGSVMQLWMTNIQDLGHSAAIAALAGAVIGPFKTVGRFLELVISRNLYPLNTYFLSMGLTLAGFFMLLALGFTLPGVLIAAALYGMGDGIKTIARGTLPLALFGAKGYGTRLGWINSISMAANASGPFVFAYITQSYGGWASFASMAAILGCAIVTAFLIPDPRKSETTPNPETPHASP